MAKFTYNGEYLPQGGKIGELLVKISNADYYVQYKTLTEIIAKYDVEIDEGEY
tara:strand:- start:19307 stop:19465 length:159 start_codon:yes stop_codon:yes gene_type:complete